jgi:hypothetical protein
MSEARIPLALSLSKGRAEPTSVRAEPVEAGAYLRSMWIELLEGPLHPHSVRTELVEVLGSLTALASTGSARTEWLGGVTA